MEAQRKQLTVSQSALLTEFFFEKIKIVSVGSDQLYPSIICHTCSRRCCPECEPAAFFSCWAAALLLVLFSVFSLSFFMQLLSAKKKLEQSICSWNDPAEIHTFSQTQKCKSVKKKQKTNPKTMNKVVMSIFQGVSLFDWFVKPKTKFHCKSCWALSSAANDYFLSQKLGNVNSKR